MTDTVVPKRADAWVMLAQRLVAVPADGDVVVWDPPPGEAVEPQPAASSAAISKDGRGRVAVTGGSWR